MADASDILVKGALITFAGVILLLVALFAFVAVAAIFIVLLALAFIFIFGGVIYVVFTGPTRAVSRHLGIPLMPLIIAKLVAILALLIVWIQTSDLVLSILIGILAGCIAYAIAYLLGE